MDYFPNNTLTRYTTRLPQMLDGSLDIEVGENQYPHSWYNLQEKEVWVAVHFLKGNELQRDHIELPAGYYPSAKRICKGIEAKKHRTELRKKYDIGLDEVNQKVGITVKDHTQVTLSPVLQGMLGFKQAIFKQEIT